MTNEEAIEYLRDPIGKREHHDEAIEMAIRALEKQNAQPCEDAISRQDAMYEIMGEHTDAHYPDWYAAKIRRLPSVKPEIIHCRDCKYWLPHTQFGYDEDNDEYYDYCKRLIPEDNYYAFRRGADEWCNRAERNKGEK